MKFRLKGDIKQLGDPKPEKKLNYKERMLLNRKLVKKMLGTKESLSKLKKDLDKVFSEFIRLRDANKPCISCGKYNKLQAGHYHSRRFTSIRWDEVNVQGQCVKCNIFSQGDFHGFTKGIIARYGESALKRLEIAKNSQSKLTMFELQFLITEYKTKVEQIKAKK